MSQLVNKLRYYLKIYSCLVRFSVSDVLIYRVNALVMGLAPIVWLVTMLIFLATIFTQVKQLGGWTFWEIVFLAGVHEVIFLLTWSTFAPNFQKFTDDVRTGKFDYVLLKPPDPRFLISFGSIDFTTFGSFLNVIFVFFYSFNKVVREIDLLRLVGFLALFFIGYCVVYFVYFIFASLSLFFVNSKTFLDWIFEIADFDRYPAEIYHSWVRTFLTFFLPVFFFSYFPTAFLLGKVGWSYLPLGALVVFILYLFSSFIWKKGLQSYQSASS